MKEYDYRHIEMSISITEDTSKVNENIQDELHNLINDFCEQHGFQVLIGSQIINGDPCFFERPEHFIEYNKENNDRK